MSATPPLPDWIRNADVPGYATAHRLCPVEPRLYGTESLYGDWGGTVLLLAKDFGPSRIVRDRIAAGEKRPYRHEPEMRTNLRLQALAEPFRDRRLLYGSALANLLRDDGDVSGPLPNRRAALAYGTRALEFTIQRMPSLRWIVCMGKEAWECARAVENVDGDWQEHRDSCTPLGRLIATFHPSARVSTTRLQAPWAALARVA